jgi:hypothetical protein
LLIFKKPVSGKKGKTYKYLKNLSLVKREKLTNIKKPVSGKKGKTY